MHEAQTISYLQNRIAYVRDEDAYRKLFFRFHPRLFRFCFRMIRHEEASEEIVSDIMLKLWLMENRLAYIDNLKLYVFKAIKNACLNYLSGKKQNISPLQWHEPEITTDEASHSPERHFLVAEAAQQLEHAVSALPPQRQMVFRLIREEGLSHRQVSEVLEISQNTIETHMRLALHRIRHQLEAYLKGA